MGCGSSKSVQHTMRAISISESSDGILTEETCSYEAANDTNNNTLTTGKTANKTTPNGIQGPTKNEKEHNILQNGALKDEKIVSQRRNSSSGVAFEVKLEEHPSNSSIKLRRPPKLQKLDHVPVLTAEMLAKKQALAEENRQKEIQKKVARTSQRKKRLLEARELDLEVENKRLEMEQKMKAQKQKREKAQAEIIKKQKIREMKAQRVRERAQRIKQGGDEANFEVDTDETYNMDDDNDMWDDSNPKEVEKRNIDMISTGNEGIKTAIADDSEQDPTNVHDFFEE